MTVLEMLNLHIKSAMKTKSSDLATLRLIKTEVVKKETSSGAKEVDEKEFINILFTMRKQRKESVEAFEKAGRNDLAEKERSEIIVIENFLPQQLTDEELNNLVRLAAFDIIPRSMKDMGKMIKHVREAAKGKADGKRISMAVKEYLKGV